MAKPQYRSLSYIERSILYLYTYPLPHLRDVTWVVVSRPANKQCHEDNKPIFCKQFSSLSFDPCSV